MNGRIRIGTAITAAAAMLALAGSAVAQTGQQPQSVSAQQSAGDVARGDALNKRYHLGRYSPAAQAGPKPAALTTQQWQAELARGDALERALRPRRICGLGRHFGRHDIRPAARSSRSQRAGSTGVRPELAPGQRSGSRCSLRGWWSSFARLAVRSCPRRAEARRSNRRPGRNGQGDLTAGPGRRARETQSAGRWRDRVGTGFQGTGRRCGALQAASALVTRRPASAIQTSRSLLVCVDLGGLPGQARAIPGDGILLHAPSRRPRPEAWPIDEAHSACSSRFRRGTPARGRARGRV